MNIIENSFNIKIKIGNSSKSYITAEKYQD